MKFNLVIIFLLFFGFTATSQKRNNTVLMQVDSLPRGIYVMGIQSLNGDDRQRRFKYIRGGRAKFRFRIETASEVRILKLRLKPGLRRAERIICFIEPGSNIRIEGRSHEDGISYRVIGGSQLNDEFMEARELIYTFLELETKYEKIGLANWKSDKQVAQKFLDRSDSIRLITVPDARIRFAEDHLEYQISSKYLLYSGLIKDSLSYYFDRIPLSTRRTYYGAKLEDYLKAIKTTSFGEVAPDFAITTNVGEPVSIHDLAKMSEYVVLDFWGTWCGPCMNEIPRLRDLYHKYKSRIEIVGIAYDDNETKWRRAIRKNGLDWIQVLNKDQNSIVDLYGVQKFPSKIVLDSNCKVVFSDLQIDEGMSFYEFIEDLFEK